MKKQKELAATGGRPAPRGMTVGQAIDQYIQQSRSEMGRTKAQVLGAVKNYAIADLDCADVKPSDIVDFATELGAGGRQPQTVLNYLSHLGSVLALARSRGAWSCPATR